MAATALEFLSVQLFGRPMRLPVALQILDNASGIFYATEIADALGLRPNNVTEELSRLQSLGMILPLPRRPAIRASYYERTDSELWVIIDAARNAIQSATDHLDSSHHSEKTSGDESI